LFGRSDAITTKGYASAIESKVNIDGNIYTESSLYIAAKLNGDIRSDSDVYIGADGIINGNIFARNVCIAGTVEGSVEASGMLRLLNTGKIYGDINVFRFNLAEGAIFEGKCSMSDLTAPKQNQRETRLIKNEGGMFRKKDYIEDMSTLQIGENHTDKS
jgi:cytoskeletal protein CcmA (bactofilin family)